MGPAMNALTALLVAFKEVSLTERDNLRRHKTPQE